jgi:hypothetical protein
MRGPTRADHEIFEQVFTNADVRRDSADLGLYIEPNPLFSKGLLEEI